MGLIPGFDTIKSSAFVLFRASRDGFSASKFHKMCDGKGPTLTIFKCRNGRLCGGYASISWESADLSYLKQRKDNKARLFSLDHYQVFKPKNEHAAVFHDRNFGPSFGMNTLTSNGKLQQGQCCTNEESYMIPTDIAGNSALTGYGRGKPENQMSFEIEDIEVH
jgi:hypothetical protein